MKNTDKYSLQDRNNLYFSFSFYYRDFPFSYREKGVRWYVEKHYLCPQKHIKVMTYEQENNNPTHILLYAH